MCGRVFIAPSAASERLLAGYGLDGAQLQCGAHRSCSGAPQS